MRKKLRKSEQPQLLNGESSHRWHQIFGVIVKEKIGAGAFGSVFVGEWNHTQVALKSLMKASSTQDFEKELELLSDLSHPNIVQFFGVFIDSKNNLSYMVMEYVPLGSGLDFVLSNSTLKHEELVIM
jgi:receptor tyrosine kinase-like orphan receptor 1